MKIILTMIFIFYLLIKPTVLPAWQCDIFSIFQAVTPVLWFEQTIDGNKQPPLITRFLHNKINIFTSQFGKCYAHYLEPQEVYAAIGIFGIFFWLYYVYHVVTEKKWVLITLFLIAPFLPILSKSPKIIDYIYKIFSIGGFLFFIKRIK